MRSGAVVAPYRYSVTSNGKHEAIDTRPQPVVREDDCVGCRLCFNVCPVERCIEMVELPSGRESVTWDQLAKTQPEVTEDWEAMKRYRRNAWESTFIDGRMPLIIRNGEIVTADSRYRADIYVEDETITRIGANLEAPPDTEIIDASGKLVFPGFIDPHVHIYLPFMATFAKDTHETASIAALVGGTTTYIEMCCPNRNDDALEGYQLWKSKAEGTALATTRSTWR